jgi:hypothetical protein
MASSWTFYKNFAQGQFGSTAARRVNFQTDPPTLQIALVKDTYTPAITDNFFDDVVGNEVTAGLTYTVGGRLLTTNTLTMVTSTGVVTFDAADITWTSSATGFGLAHYAVLYDMSGVTAANPLVAYANFQADKGNTSGDLTLQMAADGIFTVTPA